MIMAALTNLAICALRLFGRTDITEAARWAGLDDPWTVHLPSPASLYDLETAVVVSAPATKPAGSNTMIAGMRRRLARTWEPTARARIRPTPVTDLVCRHSRLL